LKSAARDGDNDGRAGASSTVSPPAGPLLGPTPSGSVWLGTAISTVMAKG